MEEQGNTPESKMNSLGRVLFYDELLSASDAVSCGTCHQQSRAFADGKRFSRGISEAVTLRNTPSITNMGNRFNFFWDAQDLNLEEMVVLPVTNHIEMGQRSMEDVIELIKSKPYYASLYTQAFGSSEVDLQRTSIALASFVRSIASNTSEFEQENNITPGEGWSNFDPVLPVNTPGAKIFHDAGCGNCHGGRDFGGTSIANIGLEMDYADQGIGGWNNMTSAIGVFKVPSLRNVAMTAPYMHDGRFNTLEEVVEHYNTGVKPHPALDWRLQAEIDIQVEDLLEQGFTIEDIDNASSLADFGISIQPIRLNLSEQDKQDLISFLKSLNDPTLNAQTNLSDPFILVPGQ